MTITDYAIQVAAKLDDGVTAPLLRIIDTLNTANRAMLDFIGSARAMSRAGQSLAGSLDRAAAGATALGDASGGLTRASYVLDTMAASSADLAANMKAARAEGRGLVISGAGGGGIGRGSGSVERSHRGATGSAAHGAAIGTLGMIGYGIYENAKLTDILTRAVMTDGTPMARQGAAVAAYRARVMGEAAQYGYASHGLADFADSYLSASRLLRGMPGSERMGIVDTILPYAAQEAFLKQISLRESLSAFIGAAHMSGAYSQKDIAHILPALINTSMATNASMGQIERAAGYAVPILRTGLGVDPSEVFTMLAIMQRAGIHNSKSGTWLADLFMNAVPGNFGAGLFHNTKQAKALRDLGLLDSHNHLTYLNRGGKLDPIKLIAQLSTGLAHLTPIERAADMKQAFGTQGARAAALLSDPKVRAMIPLLLAAEATLESPTAARAQALHGNPAAKAHQVLTNAQITITNASATFMGPVNAALSALRPASAASAGFAQIHPLAATGIGAAGIFGTLLAGKSLWGMSKLLMKDAGGLAERLVISAAEQVTGEEVGGTALAYLAAGSGVVATLGVTVAAGLGYAVGHVLNDAIDQAIRSLSGGKESNLGGWIYDLTHPAHADHRTLVERMRGDLLHGHAALAGGGSTPYAIGPYAIGDAAAWLQHAPVVHVHTDVHMDGEKVAHSVSWHLGKVHPATGMQGVNPQHSPLSPGLNHAPGM
ncbi:hypothetical protein [Thiomonas sp. FB-6]|uniref:hypothetical protein n=1 Tax=Thiomonas sp. FB-6 TaxID=1158291 RepID=UPI0003A4A581|nr:hypothetical protein [Thiomonas sp. FB-6]